MTATPTPTPNPATTPTGRALSAFANVFSRLLPARLARTSIRVLIPAITVALFIAVGSYAYFSSSATGTGTATVGALSAPVVNPPGAPNFNVTNMVPGDSDTNSMTVTVNGGAPSKVSIYEQTPSGTLLSQLNLKIVEDGTTTLYNGALASGPTSGSPLALPGTGTGGSWPAGESHSFVFTVTFTSGGNAFQSTNASVNFVWQRKL